ncbi:MAG TPA: branched-chain amino acid ABC transporter permease [Anaeromyxobacter sp.]
MQYLIDQLVSGVAVGAVYGLVAMGFALTYKATGVVNFAQGEIAMLVAYVAWSMAEAHPESPWLAVAGALAAAIVFGLVVERFIMRPMLGEPIFSTVMVTIALAVILRSATLLLWDAYPHGLELGVGRGLIVIGQTGMRTAQLGVIAALLVAMASVWAFFRFSRIGKAMRAVAADERAAQLMGISAGRVHAVAWVASSTISGMAGVFFALLYDVSPTLFQVGIKGFPATILGGLDSVLGSGFGGIVIGVVENLAAGYAKPSVKAVAGLVIIIAVLLIRPFGLFGKREIERV